MELANQTSLLFKSGPKGGDINVIIDPVLNLLLVGNTLTINGKSTNVDRNKWNTFWITIDNITGIYAVGLKKDVNHKYVTCRRIAPTSINTSIPARNMVLNTNIECKVVPFISLNLCPHKFSDDGQVSPCYGTTIMCKVSQDSNLFSDLITIQNLIKDSPIGNHYGYLDPQSFHMTIFDLKRCELDQLNDRIASQKQQLQHLMPILASDNYTMTIVDIEPTAFHVALQPVDGINSTIKQRRTQISNATGIANYSDYTFHITLAYELYKIVDDDLLSHRQQLHDSLKQAFHKWLNNNIVLQSAIVCQFDSMVNFEQFI